MTRLTNTAPACDDQLLVLSLTAEALAALRQPIRGRGGFQTLFRRIRAGRRGEVLRIERADLRALVRLASDGRLRGGYQQRADRVLQSWMRSVYLEGRPRARVLAFSRQLRLPLGDAL